MVILLQENTIRLSLLNLQNLTNQRSGVQKHVAAWQKVVAAHPDYRDGYFQLAVLEYQLGDKNTSYIYDEDALRLDPNFQSGRELEERLK
jgi:tetratricopeptide (TPR) repeat protein